MPCPSEKQFLYHLIISQLYHDGYKPHATLLEEAALDTHQAVIPSDNLRSLLSICSTTVRTADSNFSTWNKAKKCSESVATRPVQQSLLQLSQLYNHTILPGSNPSNPALSIPSTTQPVIHINPIQFEHLDKQNQNSSLFNSNPSMLSTNNLSYLSSPSPVSLPSYKHSKSSPLSEFAEELNDVLQVSSEVLNITNSPRNPVSCAIPLSPIEVIEPIFGLTGNQGNLSSNNISNHGNSRNSSHSSPSNLTMSVAQSLMSMEPPSSASPPDYSVVTNDAQSNHGNQSLGNHGNSSNIKEEPQDPDKPQNTQELLDKLQSLTNAALNNSMFQKLSSTHLNFISSQISSQRINPPSPSSSTQQMPDVEQELVEDVKPSIAECYGSPGQSIMTFGGINKEQLTLELEEMFTSQLLAQNTDKLNNILTTFQDVDTDTGPYMSSSDEKLRKPTISYPAMIAMAILNSESKRLLLGDIYKYIMDKYPYYRLEGQGWRNSIRHNLSLNDCFMKAGRAESGKGHYWTVRPDSIAEFKNGGYRRRLRRTCTRGASHAPQETMRPQISLSPFLSQLSQLKAEEASPELDPEQST